MQIVFLGFGYSAHAVYKKLKPLGFSFYASFRTNEKQKYISSLGITPVEITSLPKATHALISIPPDEGIDAAFRNSISADWVGYLSSTGVYGDHNGAWVNEESELCANTNRTKLRVRAEEAWRAKGAHIFRLGGIYGLGRNALEDAMHSETRCINKPGQFFSRINVEDIAGVVKTSIEKPSPGSVYNVVDDEPSSAREVVEYAHQLLKLPSPEVVDFEHATLSSMAREFYSANRRVSNAKIKNELAYKLLYPSYKEGLNAIFKTLKI